MTSPLVFGPKAGPRWKKFLTDIGIYSGRPAPEVGDFIIPTSEVPIVSQTAAGGGSLAALAANRSKIQLLNPVGNGYDLWIRYVGCETDGTVLLTLNHHDTALGTLVTTAEMLHMKTGQRDVSAQVRTNQGTPDGNTIMHFIIRSLVGEFFFDRGVFVLEPGQGILTQPQDNFANRTTYIWEEVPRK